MKINPTKRFLIFGLAFLVLVNSVGMLLVNYVETGFHRAIEYADESSKNSDLLSLTTKEYKSIAWIGERDFVYNGNVYDCDGISAANGKINLSCHSDNEETNLKNSLSTNFDNGTKNAPASKSMKDFFKVFPVFQNDFVAKDFSSTSSFSFDYSVYNNQLPQSAVLSLNSPPPEFI
jgi:hypothetical protein